MSSHDDAKALEYRRPGTAQLDRIERLLIEVRDLLETQKLAPTFTIPPLTDQLATIQLPPSYGVSMPPRGTGVFAVRGPNGELPDPSGTPGMTNPAVTDDPAVLNATIGTGGWTATVRPPVSYTDAVKTATMQEYGLTGKPSDFELDHLVPLCCGGHPTDVRNLWPQRREGVNGAPLKDITEVLAQHAVLAGHIPLSAAQQGFMTDWTKLHARLTSNPEMMKLLMGLAPPEQEP